MRDYISCVRLLFFFFPYVHDAWPQCISLFRSEVTEPRRWSLLALRLCWVFLCLSFVSFVHTHKKLQMSSVIRILERAGVVWHLKKNEGQYFTCTIGVFALCARCLATMLQSFSRVSGYVSFTGSFTLKLVKNTEFNANNLTQLCQIFVLRMGVVGCQIRKWQNCSMFIFYLFESGLK